MSDPVNAQRNSSGGSAVEAMAAKEARLNRMAAEQYGYMYRVAFRILRNQQEAEEALHNAWVNLCRAARLPEIADERAYVAQATRREAIELLKRGRRFPVAEEGAELRIEDVRSSPEQSAEAVFLLRKIHALPPKELIVVRLWYREGLSFVEIAELLALPESTVRRRFMRARANLKPMFVATPLGSPARAAGPEVAAGERSTR